MSERLHGLAQVLPDKTSLEECSLEELQHIAKRFPYFAPAQFLLLQKLRETGSADYEAQQRKAVLYFHDPLLFDYFISSEKYLLEDSGLASAITQDSSSQPEVANAFPSSAVATDSLNISADNDQEEAELLPPPPVQFSTDTFQKFSEPDKVEETTVTASVEPVVLPFSPLQEKLQTDLEKKPVMAGPEEERAMIVAPELNVVPVQEDTPSTEESLLPVKAEQRLPAETGAPLLFEPFHTVDYFASQGIKISAEELPKDRLSNQVRSFTEWLKIMKRLPAAEMEATPQTSAEKTVESLASHSVEGGDVLTEAMAEVWARQGNKRKAIETYNKLSLLNPSKKAYFAAKIENLTGT